LIFINLIRYISSYNIESLLLNISELGSTLTTRINKYRSFPYLIELDYYKVY